MSDQYLGEMRIFPIQFAPRGWADCDGQLLPINQNQSLYAVIGTTYGGDGRTTFALPDLRDKVAMHHGTGTVSPIGSAGGEAAVALTSQNTPVHTHQAMGSESSVNGAGPNSGQVFGQGGGGGRTGGPVVYATVQGGAVTALEGSMVGMTGTGAPHSNIQPSLGLRYCIAIQGLFPPRN